MAVFFIFGKPGAGKSYYALNHIIQELKTTQRTIVTNLAIKPGELNDYLQETTVDVLTRLRVIDNDDLKTWWLYRGKESPHDASSEWCNLSPPDHSGKTRFDASPGPILYVLDEIHIAFNARAWASTGPGALFYLSQHRKLGDDVVMISQTPAQVDKQLRSLSQEWIHLVNLRKLKFLFLWGLPNRLLWKSYSNMPQRGEPILSTGLLQIDQKGMARCYDTASGAGIAGGGAADKGLKSRGIPWQSVFLIPLIALFLWFGGSKLFSFGLDKFTPKAPTGSAPTPGLIDQVAPFLRSEEQPKQPDAAPSVHVTQYYRAGPYAAAWLSDGTKADTRNGRLESINKTHAVVEGVRLPLPQ